MGDVVQGPWALKGDSIDAYRRLRDDLLRLRPCRHTTVLSSRGHLLCERCGWYVEDLLVDPPHAG